MVKSWRVKNVIHKFDRKHLSIRYCGLMFSKEVNILLNQKLYISTSPSSPSPSIYLNNDEIFISSLGHMKNKVLWIELLTWILLRFFFFSSKITQNSSTRFMSQYKKCFLLLVHTDRAHAIDRISQILRTRQISQEFWRNWCSRLCQNLLFVTSTTA